MTTLFYWGKFFSYLPTQKFLSIREETFFQRVKSMGVVWVTTYDLEHSVLNRKKSYPSQVALYHLISVGR